VANFPCINSIDKCFKELSVLRIIEI